MWCCNLISIFALLNICFKFALRNDTFFVEKLVFPSPNWSEVFHSDVEKPSQLIIVAGCIFLGHFRTFTKSISFDFLQRTATKNMLGKKCNDHLGSINPMPCDLFRWRIVLYWNLIEKVIALVFLTKTTVKFNSWLVDSRLKRVGVLTSN